MSGYSKRRVTLRPDKNSIVIEQKIDRECTNDCFVVAQFIMLLEATILRLDQLKAIPSRKIAWLFITQTHLNELVLGEHFRIDLGWTNFLHKISVRKSIA